MGNAHARAFTAWLNSFFASYYRHRPVNATFIGVHTYDDRLPDYSASGVNGTIAEMETLLASLRELPSEPLTEAETLDQKLAEGFLRIQLWEYGSAHSYRANPSVYTGEGVFGVIALFLRPFAPLAERVESAVARMAAIPVLLAQGRENVCRAPRAWTERAVRECIGARAFFGEGVDVLIREHKIADPRLRAAAATAAAAFAEFQCYLEVDLLAEASSDYGCGGEAFDLLMRRGHFLEWDARVLVSNAQERIAACEDHLRTHAAEFGAQKWPEALAHLADRHPVTKAYYSRYVELWEASRAAVDARKLLTWPDYPIRYVPQPSWARAAAPYLYFIPYRSPAPYDHLPVVDYMVTPIEPGMPPDEQTRLLRATNDSVIKLNHVIHHGGIGHHVQNWHACRAASRIGRVAAVDCASRIAMLCGGTMTEGWACYATDLMDEIGFLTPLERFALHHHRLRIAARALVDVQLHQGAFTLEEAEAFYRNRVGMDPNGAHAEAVKNSMFPGTAMMYMVGADLIHALRRELAQRQKGEFDLRRFHDQFLSCGSVPVPLICASMRQGTARSHASPGLDIVNSEPHERT